MEEDEVDRETGEIGVRMSYPDEWAGRVASLDRAYPEVFPLRLMLHALNFVLGCHPGANTASFVSGVGASSLEVAYGFNRDDWAFIPGGSASGTALAAERLLGGAS
jgi:hypothetical protein